MNDEQRRNFLAGTETHAYRFMGCHRETRNGRSGYVFRVWAPNARSVHVAGTFNNWDTGALPMQWTEGGVYEAFSETAKEFDEYKYFIEKANGGYVWKADPYGFTRLACRRPPAKFTNSKATIGRTAPTAVPRPEKS